MYIFEIKTDTGICIVEHAGADWNSFDNAQLKGSETPVSICIRLFESAKGSFGHSIRLNSCTPGDINSALEYIENLPRRRGFVSFKLTHGQRPSQE